MSTLHKSLGAIQRLCQLNVYKVFYCILYCLLLTAYTRKRKSKSFFPATLKLSNFFGLQHQFGYKSMFKTPAFLKQMECFEQQNLHSSSECNKAQIRMWRPIFMHIAERHKFIIHESFYFLAKYARRPRELFSFSESQRISNTATYRPKI